ncbi:class III lanthipeptide [Streptomyces nondiastaticus]|nr:class III lanthipeptide [Streptomyces sp. VNUA116]WKU43026.1 class III lanthipeptide [Streptomyces sp. VNUA116]
MSSILKLQSMEARTTQSAAAVVSLTSSGNRCCKGEEERPGNPE